MVQCFISICTGVPGQNHIFKYRQFRGNAFTASCVTVDIKSCCSNCTAAQRFNQVSRANQAPACCIDENGRPFHFRKRVTINEPVCLRGTRHMNRDNIAFTENLLCRSKSDIMLVRKCMVFIDVISDESAAKALQQQNNIFCDIPEAKQSYGLSVQCMGQICLDLIVTATNLSILPADESLAVKHEGNGLFCYSFCIAAGQNGHRDSVSAGSSNIDAVCTNSIADQQLQRILACMQCLCAPTFIGCDDKIVAIAALSDFSLIRAVFEGFIPYRFNAQCFEPGNGRIVILPHITDSNFACITHW